LIRGLQAGQLPSHVIRLREQTRANIIVTTKDVRQLDLSPPARASHIANGSESSKATGEQVQFGAARKSSPEASLPAVPDRAYRELIAKARTVGVSSLLDCDGKSFRPGIRAAAVPGETECA